MMIEFNIQQFRTEPTIEQVEGIKHLVSKPRAALFDRPGFGKTKQVIDAACVLSQNNEIDTVVVVAPASVCGVWSEPTFGELTKHCWVEYQVKQWKKGIEELPKTKSLLWVIVSYGFIRKKQGEKYPEVNRLVKQLRERKFWFVLDESSFIKSRDSNQFKACREFSEYAERVCILNGTPIGNGVVDLWSQFTILDSSILDNGRDGKPMTFPEFRSRYCIVKQVSLPNRRPFLQILGDNKEAVDELRKKAKPWIMRRLTTNLPPKTYSIIEAELNAEEWRTYNEMRETLVAWFKENPSSAANGAVKTVRLAQITSGYLGGVTELGDDITEDLAKEVEIGDSKQKAFFEWLETIPREEQIIVWCRFRSELQRLGSTLSEKGYSVGYVYGGQSNSVRQNYINEFQSGNLNVLIGQPRAGGLGLNLQNAHIEVYMSLDYSYLVRDQSEGRVHRRGQTQQVLIIDILAKGPNGQNTIDHTILKTLRAKEDFANWTSEHWINALKDSK